MGAPFWFLHSYSRVCTPTFDVVVPALTSEFNDGELNVRVTFVRSLVSNTTTDPLRSACLLELPVALATMVNGQPAGVDTGVGTLNTTGVDFSFRM